ncbi:MAG: hypothetical protein HY744_00615 [Deltaproteobacteria bacterium]|nr:hypothetical protein [Deltaproteobacteria bacterium]
MRPIPAPLDPGAGYVSQAPSRYQFLRSDVAVALLGALRQTRTRFRRDPLAIGDASQWDGGRPASDLGTTRHISHLGGRDVDVALASDDPEAPSLFVRHCQGVRTELDVFQCAPGTVHGFDALRMAYFLGLLVDGPTPNGIHMPEGRPGPIAEVETIYTDQAYIDEVGRAAQVLRERRWIHDDGYAALGEDGIMRPSPWHTDHVHVRFGGEAARAPLTPAPGSSP